MKLTRTEILWTRSLLMREAESIRGKTIEARKRNDPFTLLAVIQAENYESVAKKLDDLLEKKDGQEFKVICCRERGRINMAKEFITREHVKFMSAQLKDMAAHHRNGVKRLDHDSNPYINTMREAARCEKSARWLDSLLENETEYKRVVQEFSSFLTEMKAQYDLFWSKEENRHDY